MQFLDICRIIIKRLIYGVYNHDLQYKMLSINHVCYYRLYNFVMGKFERLWL